jgi:hypothetical protein
MSAPYNAPSLSAPAKEWALYYLRRGWSVVPVRRGEKIPAVPWHQFQHRRATIGEIEDWFTDPTMGVGIVTGPISNLIVADFDGALGAETEAQILPRIGVGPVALTGGGGTHRLMAHPGRKVPTRTGVLPGMDIRGDGGFIVAPPSIHASGRQYSWDVDFHIDDFGLPTLTDSLTEIICRDVIHGTGSVSAVTHAAGPLGLQGAITDGREQYMRDTVLAVVSGLSKRLGRLPTEEEVVAEGWPQYAAKVDFRRPGRGEAEFRMKVRYTLDRAERGVLRLEQPNSVATDSATPSAQGVADGVAPAGGLPLVYFTDINANLDAADFVEGLLTEGGMSVTYGESNCGKTFFMTDLALHVASGMEWNGRAVEEGGVIYCALEGSHGISNRVTAWRKHHQMEGVLIPFAIIPISINLLDPAADTERLIQAITKAQGEMQKPVRLVILDTLSRALAGGNENAPDDMGALVANIDRVRQVTGAHVNGVHHSGKDTAKGARGHSLLRAATDTEIEITRASKDSPSVATVKKQRDLEIEGEWIFKLTTIELGRNRRNKPVTSCIITPADPEEAKPTGPKLNMWEVMAIQALKDAIGERGEMGFGNLPRVKMVPVDTWKAKWWSRASIEPDNKKRATWARTKNRILLLKIAIHKDEKVWLYQEDSEEGRQA